jgi:hypothetical protein
MADAPMRVVPVIHRWAGKVGNSKGAVICATKARAAARMK